MSEPGACPNPVQLQPKSQTGSGNLSELRSTSAKITTSKCIFVRTRCNFRQNHRSKAKICPNLVHLQTKSQAGSEKLSEPGATSDKITGQKRKYVRTWCTFRQNLRSKAKICPNPDQLWTKSQVKSENMSEPDAPSDKISGRKRKIVRIRCNFGQNPRAEAEICPNPVQLQPKSQGGSENMSEPGVTSAKIPGRKRKYVRTWCNFGQNSRPEAEILS
jgi:hypothetical protein